MSPVLSEILRSGFMVNSIRRRTHLVQSFSVVFLYWFYVFSYTTMDSCSGASSGSYLRKSLVGGDVDERKRKRMISNKESTRRSRMRKRKHTEDLTAQVSQLIIKNGRIVQSLSSTGQLYLDVEVENSILRARVAELRSRLESLNGIVDYVNSMNVLCGRTTEIYVGT